MIHVRIVYGIDKLAMKTKVTALGNCRSNDKGSFISFRLNMTSLRACVSTLVLWLVVLTAAAEVDLKCSSHDSLRS